MMLWHSTCQRTEGCQRALESVVFEALQILTIILVAIAMALSLAHALELPGKLRLSEEHYRAVQPIYYPGFTVGGFIGEFGGMVAALVLVVMTPTGTLPFWLALGAFIALLIMHLLYWVLTHPVNNFWLAGFKLKGAGAAFFKANPVGHDRPSDPATAPDWTALRDRWEHSHVARAFFAMLALVLVSAAATLQ